MYCIVLYLIYIIIYLYEFLSIVQFVIKNKINHYLLLLQYKKLVRWRET